jgi:hypothetical protein
MNAKYFILTLSLLLSALLVQACTDSTVSNEKDTLITSSAEILPAFSQKTDGPSPQKVYNDFMEMVDKVHQMNREEIEAMSDAQIIELGKPILDATEGTIKLPESTLQKLEKPLRDMALKLRSMTRQDHRTYSEKVQQVIRQNREQLFSYRDLNSNQVKTILLDYNDSGVIQSQVTCSSMFNIVQGYIFLYPGDNLNLANDLCPAGSIFYVHSGTYYSQSIEDSKFGNTWVGVGTGGSILDGQGSTSNAFINGMDNNSISWLKIRNYKQNGIFSSSNKIYDASFHQLEFLNISPYDPGDDPGEFRGAINLNNCENIEVTSSYFEDVVSGVLFTNCDGPLKVNGNESLNPGRNFHQCDGCEGAGIQINNNSLEHDTGYGNTVLEDWINLSHTYGTDASYVQVNNNRARVILSGGTTATKVSNSGCFILMGDSGGRYQEAINNYGVNPGNCGIGVASGEWMRVKDNKMFSLQNNVSNVAYYSQNFYSTPCTEHNFFSGTNEANWTCGDLSDCTTVPSENRAHADEKCTDQNGDIITRTILRSRITPKSFGSEIWNLW